MTSDNSFSEIERIILEALRQGDRTQGELFDLIVKSYPTLTQTLRKLKDRKLIETYFVVTETIPILTYRLLPKS
ncbi:hypothetical protein BST81_01985 [Leptolyngbya sp. 'hensonii']|uniref:helix-turn-helix domain-containing protein n=1 Tax=Leptolyngbya sp. 'hensonii' TaxID=1922337 RepID=UPI00094FB1CC|nr:helix-turn-helix domain-containing protein [Leptolyngbya sp. 'hensonii']OLP20032.1 hypothetical protein BST81_01985 [Leptolyngbya sp. 'hensonii']